MEDDNFWNQHSVQFLEMAYTTDFRERIIAPDGYGARTGDCGDRVEFFVIINKGKLTHICFDVQGCVYTMACCNTVIHLAQGLKVEKAWEISPDQVADFLETLPEDHFHCAELALGGFYLALSDYENKRSGGRPGGSS